MSEELETAQRERDLAFQEWKVIEPMYTEAYRRLLEADTKYRALRDGQ